MMWPIVGVSVLVMLSACAGNSGLTCLDGADAALDLEKEEFRKAIEHGTEGLKVFMAQDFTLKTIIPIARDNEIPYVQCRASVMGKNIKQISETDTEGTTTRWELDEEKGVDELTTFIYSVRVVEDAGDYDYWIMLDEV